MRQLWPIQPSSSLESSSMSKEDFQQIITAIADLNNKVDADIISLSNYKEQLANALNTLSVSTSSLSSDTISSKDITSIRATILSLISNDITSPNGSIDTLLSVLVTAERLVANDSVTSRHVYSDDVITTDLSATDAHFTNLRVDNPPQFDSFSSDEVQSDTIIGNTANIEDVTSDTVTTRAATIAEAEITNEEVQNGHIQTAELDIAEIDHIIHNKEYQLIDKEASEDYYIKLPKCNNGGQRLIATNASIDTQIEWTFEEFISIDNQMHRWSNRTAKPSIPLQVVDIRIDSEKYTWLHIVPLSDEYVYYISDDFDNTNKPTIYTEYNGTEEYREYRIINESASKYWYPVVFDNDESSTPPLTYHTTDDYDGAQELNEHDTIYDASEAKVFTQYTPDQDVNTDADVVHNSVTINKDTDDTTDNGTIRLKANGDIEAEGDVSVDGDILAGKTTTGYHTMIADGDIATDGNLTVDGYADIGEENHISDTETNLSRHLYIGPHKTDAELSEILDEYALVIIEEED